MEYAVHMTIYNGVCNVQVDTHIGGSDTSEFGWHAPEGAPTLLGTCSGFALRLLRNCPEIAAKLLRKRSDVAQQSSAH